jgi:drug/metabolite transporter (DMT)-like permease
MNSKNLNLNLTILSILALLFLALNSIFCKLALANNYIDAYSFTFLRLLFASIVLLCIFYIKHKKIDFSYKTNWLNSFMLFLYAICFSFAYLSIDAGFGALLLFGTVQVFLFIASIFYKEKVNLKKLFGISIAFLGLVILLYPSEKFDLSYFHAFLMIVSGLAWSVYSLLGKNSSDYLKVNMDSFIKATIFIVISALILFESSKSFVSFEGIVLAFLSGGLTSGIGYVLWYYVVSKIEILTSSVIQLFVPIIAILLSVVFLDELLTSTLILSTSLIILGVILTLFKK